MKKLCYLLLNSKNSTEFYLKFKYDARICTETQRLFPLQPYISFPCLRGLIKYVSLKKTQQVRSRPFAGHLCNLE